MIILEKNKLQINGIRLLNNYSIIPIIFISEQQNNAEKDGIII
jgi:hypothetical protein